MTKHINGVEKLRSQKRRDLAKAETCFAAAAQGISDTHTISDETYSAYEAALLEQILEGSNAKRTREILRTVLRDAGGSSYEGFSRKRARSLEETVKILENARQGGRRVIIYTEERHVVGLRAVSGGWRMVGVRTPVDSQTVLTSAEVFEHLFIPSYIGSDKKRRFAGKLPCNILTLNPERKQK